MFTQKIKFKKNKKIIGFILSISFLLCSCSSNNNSSQNSNSSINPPSWIQGTWLLEDSPTLNPLYRFTSDDFCLIDQSTISTCFKQYINQNINAGIFTNVTEIITDDSYSIEITLGGQILYYEFEKKSNTQIEWINDTLGDLAETILVKQ